MSCGFSISQLISVMVMQVIPLSAMVIETSVVLVQDQALGLEFYTFPFELQSALGTIIWVLQVLELCAWLSRHFKADPLSNVFVLLYAEIKHTS